MFAWLFISHIGSSTSMYQTASKMAILKKYGTDVVESEDDDGDEMRIGSALSHRTETEAWEESHGRSSLAMQMRAQSVAQSGLSSAASSSHRARTPYMARDSGADLDYYPIEEMDLDFDESMNMEIMLRRNGRIDHIGSAGTFRAESPFMRSVSQATARPFSSRAGERGSLFGSVLSDVEAELMLQGRISALEDEIIASEVGLPVSPEWFGRLARPNTAEGK